MAAIPNTDYKDVFVKDGDTWYKREAVGKYIINGTETISAFATTESGKNRFGIKAGLTNVTTIEGGSTLSNLLCSHLKAITRDNTFNNITGICYGIASGYYGNFIIYIDSITTTPEMTAWLNNNNVEVRYILAEAQDIEITNETLADQLEEIKNAISYSGQTNVSQTNNDKPFILDLSALKEGSDHLVINNSGNIYAKPTIDIEGTGVVDIYLNDVQILEADLSETNNIVIDTEAMEAYNPDTNALANRQVTGDYSKIKLEPGENDLRFSGDLSKATVTKYKRWL